MNSFPGMGSLRDGAVGPVDESGGSRMFFVAGGPGGT